MGQTRGTMESYERNDGSDVGNDGVRREERWGQTQRELLLLLDLFRAQLSPKRYWRGFREVCVCVCARARARLCWGEGWGRLDLAIHCHHQNDSVYSWAMV